MSGDTPPSSGDFAGLLDAWMRRAEAAGERALDVRAGDLHRAVGGYPGASARMPTCCDVMHAAMRPGDVVVESPPRGRGASLTVRYALPRQDHAASRRRRHSGDLTSGPEPTTGGAGAAERLRTARPRAAPTLMSAVPTGERPFVLVSCVKEKLATPAPARDLYVSTLFRGMRAYAERHGRAWFILSAKHGVLHPEERVEPYEQTLAAMKRIDRDAWGRRVVDRLAELLPPGVPLVILASVQYRRPIEATLRDRGHEITVPMEGLRIGEQRRWLNAQRYEF